MTGPAHVSDFHTLALEYERFRSSYSDALFDAILEYAGPLRGRRALDLACGTGLSTLGLIRRGIAVTGVDIAPAMLDFARTRFGDGSRNERGVDWSGELQLAVRREAANVVGQAELATSATFYEARAETLPFADESFGLVICGQAFHWFDAARTLHEIERVLAPGGAHAQFWKHQLPDDPYAKAADDLERSMSGRKPGDMFEPTWERLRDVWRSCGLVDRRRIELDIGLPFTVESFVGYESSRESLRLALGERRFEYLAELRRMIAAMAPAGGAFEVRAKEYLFLARRRPPA